MTRALVTLWCGLCLLAGCAPGLPGLQPVTQAVAQPVAHPVPHPVPHPVAAATLQPAMRFEGPSGQSQAPSEGLQVITPRAVRSSTTAAAAHVLGRTAATAQVWVAGQAVTVYATGVFARDGVPLAPGPNPLSIEVRFADGRALTQVLEVERLPLPATAAPAAQAAAEPSASTPAASTAATTTATTTATTDWRSDTPRLYTAGPEGVQLLHGVHSVRLGGPFLAELPAGTLLPVTGRFGAHYRVALASDTTAWAVVDSLQPAPPGTPRPHAAFTSLQVQGSARGDVISIPVPPGLPYAARVVNSPGGFSPNGLHPSGAKPSGTPHIELDLYGAHHAATWISHKASARQVREVSVHQVADGHVRVLVQLQHPRLWGWRVDRLGDTLQITVRPPPWGLAAAAWPHPNKTASHTSPLRGLRIALEAGHGGATNLGAIGATGVPEKDVNRLTSDALQAELQAAGAQVIELRTGDDNPTLAERAQGATDSDAHLFISVHANAADTARGVLRAQGTSSYYHHAHSRDLAASIQAQLLRDTAFADFGLVGGFNYLPLRRITWMPAVLFEHGFMTHPGDEALMLDSGQRARTARAVRIGIEHFLRAP